MLILSFDTSTDFCTVAAGIAGKVLAEENVFAPRSHAEKLLPLIDAVLKKASLTLDELEVIAVGLGPGSFTGVRIGVSTARALAQALDKPVIGISSLDALAYTNNKGMISPVVEARKNEVYFSVYKREKNDLERLTEYLVATPDDCANQLKQYPGTLLTGDALGTYGQFFEENLSPSYKFAPASDWFPRASHLLSLAHQRHEEARDLFEIKPIYLRRPAAEVPGSSALGHV